MVSVVRDAPKFEDALSQLAALHAQELETTERELRSEIARLQASLVEAEALKTAATEPRVLAAVIEDIAQDLLGEQQEASVSGEDARSAGALKMAKQVSFGAHEVKPGLRESTNGSDGPQRMTTRELASALESSKGLLTSNMNSEALAKLHRMQQEISKKEKAIGEISSRVRKDSGGKSPTSVIQEVSLNCILSSRSFGLFVASMIVFNSILLGLDVKRNQSELETQILRVLGEVCNGFFFIELCLRLWCYKASFVYGEDYGWNLFDSFLVVSSVLDVILTYTAADISPALAASMKMLKLFRIMRVFRVFRFFRELGNWAMMIIDSLKSLFGALILLGIIVYVFAVSLSMNTADWLLQQESAGMVDRMLYEDVETWFGSLGSTVYTLMLSILGGVSWHIVCDLLFRIDILSACMLLFYIMFTIFSVLNVITGVFVDSAIQTTNSQRDIQIERELELKDSFLKSLKDFFEALDTDGNGAIHLDEIKIMLQDQTLAAYFAVLGFDEVNAHQIFHLLDDDESGEVSIQEFLDGCAKLKGQARSIDVHAIMHQCRALHRDISFVGSQLGVDLHQAAHASRQSHWFGRQTQTSVLQPNSKRLSAAA
ncbi:CACNA1C [Symbiodinium sp. CCMP2592]|nr:CACNA1C [Symbiodinium sp. CCMP2592]